MGIFTDTINGSMEWTGKVLFKPFKFKKWLVLGFVAWLAGSLGGGSFRVNLPNSSSAKKPSASATVASGTPSTRHVKASPARFSRHEAVRIKNKMQSALHTSRVRTIAAGVLAVFLAFMIFFCWLYSRFSFVFLHDVVHDVADIKAPFKATRVPGQSYFLFTLCMNAVVISLTLVILFLCALKVWHIFLVMPISLKGILHLMLATLPYVGALILLTFASGLVHLAVRDFTVPVMYKDQSSIAEAWLKVRKIIDSNNFLFFKYLLAKIGVVMCIEMLFGLISIAVAIAMMAPLGGGIVLGALIVKMIPHAFQVATIIAAALVLIPVFIAIAYIVMCFRLPASVFVRTWSIRFLGAVAPEYNLFAGNAVKEN